MVKIIQLEQKKVQKYVDMMDTGSDHKNGVKQTSFDAAPLQILRCRQTFEQFWI